MTIRLFREETVRDFIKRKYISVMREVNQLTDDQLLSESLEKYIQMIRDRYYVKFPNLEFIDSAKSLKFKNVTPDRKSHKFAEYEIKYTGDINLLRCRPNTYTLNLTDLVEVINHNTLILNVPNLRDNAEQIKKSYEAAKSNIIGELDKLREDLSKFNDEMDVFVKEQVDHLKNEALKKKDLFNRLQ